MKKINNSFGGNFDKSEEIWEKIKLPKYYSKNEFDPDKFHFIMRGLWSERYITNKSGTSELGWFELIEFNELIK